MTTPQNHLYYGDNLEVLRRHIPDESVDLVYLDPPFNSNADYNVLFAEEDGSRAAAQIVAFGDTWRWDQAAASAFQETVEHGGEVAKAMMAFQTLLGDSNMLAYLAMMAPRLVELRRTLKPTGSIYLHCDPTASHYLKLLMDAVFGAENFRNEIIWRRTGSHAPRKTFGPIHDTILFYSAGEGAHFVPLKRPYMAGHVAKRFKSVEGRWRESIGGNIMTGAGTSGGESGQPWRGIDPSASNRHWAIPGDLAAQMPEQFKELGVISKLDALFEAGLLELKEGNKWPHPVRYLRPNEGTPIGDIWASQPYTGSWAATIPGTVFDSTEDIDADVRWLGRTDAERLGYPTQKPLGLMERIIRASCPEGGRVLDPFCGCGTTIVAAEDLGRSWIGIDVTYLAVALMKSRLKEVGSRSFTVIGEPTAAEDAAQLAADDPYQFQFWSLGLIGARPLDEKKGADKGIDGRLYFFDDGGSKAKQLIVSVKAGKVQVSHVRDLVGVLDREKAQIGAFISLNEPTGPMRKEAASAGMYKSPLTGTTHPRIQLITVAELLDGRTLDLPAIAPQQSMTAKPVTAPSKAKPDQMTLGSE